MPRYTATTNGEQLCAAARSMFNYTWPASCRLDVSADLRFQCSDPQPHLCRHRLRLRYNEREHRWVPRGVHGDHLSIRSQRSPTCRPSNAARNLMLIGASTSPKATSPCSCSQVVSNCRQTPAYSLQERIIISLAQSIISFCCLPLDLVHPDLSRRNHSRWLAPDVEISDNRQEHSNR